MSERKRKRAGRARLAVRAIVLAALLVAALNSFAGTGYLLPRQAVRAQERASGVTERTEVLTRSRFEATGARGWVYLTANETVLCLTFTELTAAGWVAHGQVLDCAADEAVVFATRREGRANERYETPCDYIFGCVRDDAVERVVYAETWNGGQTELEAGEWFACGDGRYFLLRHETEHLMLTDRYVAAYRADGTAKRIEPS